MNLSDNEIIKALEYCSNPENTCENCELYEADDDNCECASKLRLSALALINRLKAENERLTKLTELDDKHIKSLEKAFNNRTVQYRTAKSEARKEFAERLKENTSEIVIGGVYKYKVITVQGIDHFLKETGCE